MSLTAICDVFRNGSASGWREIAITLIDPFPGIAQAGLSREPGHRALRMDKGVLHRLVPDGLTNAQRTTPRSRRRSE
jgi:hypothetical protein